MHKHAAETHSFLTAMAVLCSAALILIPSVCGSRSISIMEPGFLKEPFIE